MSGHGILSITLRRLSTVADERTRIPDLVSCKEAAELAGVSRQAVLQAADRGQLTVVVRGPRGKLMFDRRQVLEWKKTVRRVNRRPHDTEPIAPSAVAPKRDESPSPTVPPRSRRKGPAARDGVRPAGILSADLLERMATQVLTPAIAEELQAALKVEATNHRRVAEVEGEQIEVRHHEVELRLQQVDLGLRKVEMERNRIERDNNVRQLRDRFSAWFANRADWSGPTRVIVSQLLSELLLALGDDAVARAAAAGNSIEGALIAGRSEWNAWTKNTGVPLADLRGRSEFLRLWISNATVALGAPPPATPDRERSNV
jgi:hypothetical protein